MLRDDHGYQSLDSCILNLASSFGRYPDEESGPRYPLQVLIR
jgi:hypothetical protein